MAIDFVKMSVLGNDFVIIDIRGNKFNLDFIYISDRKNGVGCDQVLLIDYSQVADCKMIVYNSDGTFAEACGNGTCAVANLMFDILKKDSVTIESHDSILSAWKIGKYKVKTTVPNPTMEWDKIPLSKKCDTLSLPINIPGLWDYRVDFCIAVNVGNPHVVFFCENVDKVDIESIGLYMENHQLFPNRTNVSVVEIVNDALKMRVWERGVGETDACGTAASAAFYAAIKKNYLKSNSCIIHFKNGDVIVGLENDAVVLTANVVKLFNGTLNCDVDFVRDFESA